MYYFIVNPNSKSRKGIKIWKQLKERLIKEDVPFRECITKKAGEATEIARRITKEDKTRNIMILGGDGTLHEVISGIEHISKVFVGYIPTGSSNDFARGMKLTSDIDYFLEHLLKNPKAWTIDYGTTSVTGGQRERFLVSSGIGYDAKVCYLANETKMKKVLNSIKLGKLTYIQIGLQGLMEFQMFHAKVIMDGREIEFDDTLFISVHNLPYEGGGIKFCPDAKVDDGYLDVCIVAGISKKKMLLLLPKAMTGKHVGCKGVYQYQCKKIQIETDQEQFYHMDGEVPGKTREMDVEVSKEGIRFL